MHIWIGAEAAAEVDAWASGLGVEIICEQLLTSGLSDAIVGSVLLKSQVSGGRRAIFKCIPADGGVQEGGSHGYAYDNSPHDFADKHLVRLYADPLPLRSGAVVTLQELAGGDVRLWRPLASLSGTEELETSIVAVANSILNEWNPNPTVEEMTVGTFMGDRARTRFGEDSAQLHWLSDQYQAGLVASTWIRFGDNSADVRYLNPLRLVAGTGVSLIEEKISVIVGNSHGDLHLENIFVKLDGGISPDHFRLIDLAEFSPTAALSHDPVSLVVSELERLLVPIRDELRGKLMGHLSHSSSARPTELVGVLRLWDSALAVGERTATSRGFGAEWAPQMWLSVVRASLVLSGRERLAVRDRRFFFELAALAATKWLDLSGVAVEPSEVLSISLDQSAEAQAAAAAADIITAECSNFDSAVISIAVISRGQLTEWERVELAGVGWDLVIDFDQVLAEVAVQKAKGMGEPVQLVTPSDTRAFTRKFTTWLAAAGLAPVGAAAIPESFVSWRRAHLTGVRAIANGLLGTVSGPVKIVVLGIGDDYVRSVIDALLDGGGLRTSLIVIGDSKEGPLAGYEPQFAIADPRRVVHALPRRPTPSPDDVADVSIPGGPSGNRTLVTYTDRAWLEDGFELLHSKAGAASDAVERTGQDFYNGRRISWFELQADFDLPRGEALPALEAVVRSKLAKRGTDRQPYRHYPGAGGTTIARRLGWMLRNEHPVLLATQLVEPARLSDRVQMLATMTGRKVFVVVENSSEAVTDVVFETLRSSSVPSLLLLVSRSTNSSELSTIDPTKNLGLMSSSEQRDFVRFFAALTDGRRDALARIGRPGGEVAVPFMYGLTAFQDDFVGLRRYVASFLSEVEDKFRPVLVIIAIAHRYAGISVHSSVFADHLRLPPNSPVRLDKRLSVESKGLLIEERRSFWRVSHQLVAQEVLAQLLQPSELDFTSNAEAWKYALPEWCEKLIDFVASTHEQNISFDASQLLTQLFIARDVVNGDRSRFSDLIAALPSEGRSRVFVKLVTEFPSEPHFWAHYARWLSVEQRDFGKARGTMDTALELQPGDALLWHMKGTNTRRELWALLDEHRRKDLVPDPSVLLSIEHLTRDALADFTHARGLDNTSDYPLISTAELCLKVIEWAKPVYGASTYGALFAKPSAAFYSELLDTTFEALEFVEELRGDDRDSANLSAVKAQLQGVLDNYSAMLEGWRNALDRATGKKNPIRARLARLYGMRRGGWQHASVSEVSAAMSLLQDGLKDDPSDRSIVRTWLFAARKAHVSLDRAIEVVSYWVENEFSRESLFYDYVLTTVAAHAGGLAMQEPAQRKLEKMRSLAQGFAQKRTIFEWLGPGDGFSALVSSVELRDWERDGAQDPKELKRVPGRVTHIDSVTRGRIVLENLVECFFVPQAAGLVKDRDINAVVSCLVGFSYDGPQAWSVRIEEPAP
jgi:hypothetical protein